METLDDTNWRAIVAEALLAPSVHNIQPTRVRIDNPGMLTLLYDRRRALPIADPKGVDVEKSHGAFVEGLVLALSARGLGARLTFIDLPEEPHHHAFARLAIEGRCERDPLQTFVATRASFRGVFDAPDAETDAALDALETACEDLHLLRDRHTLSTLASFYDDVSLDVLSDAPYRAELIRWMRLSRDHEHWGRDGLNADAMALSRFEAAGANIVLRDGVFETLDAIGLARPLIGESAKVRAASAVALFHLPQELSAFETGRRFYRVWLTMESLGLALCPMSVLADIPSAAERTKRDYRLDPQHTLVNVLRIGKRPAGPSHARARLPIDEIILPSL
jgi:nitroreductase